MKRPLPTASIRPSCGFSLAVSGRTIPLLVRSSRSTGLITTRSPSGRKRMFEPSLTVAVSTLIPRVLIIAEAGTADKRQRPCQGSPAGVRSGPAFLAVSWEEGSMKRVVRLLVVLLPLALLAGTVPASANDEAGYLALGDSYAFGFNPLVVLAGGASNPANFPGYTDALAGFLDLNLANAACPGETSGSMISGTRPDNGCQDFRTLFPLHVQYTGAQLAFAVSYLQSHRHTDLVTIQVGGNDVLTLQRICAGDAACIIRQLPGVEAQMAANLNVIYAAIRTGAHYRHAIVVVPYFAFNYNDPNMVAIAGSLDSVVVTV